MNRWYRINFKIKWDRKPPANFHIDLMIIDLLINPAVNKFKEKFGDNLWTFHRAAASNDPDGHTLLFNFYTEPKTAEKVFEFIKSNGNYSLIKKYLELDPKLTITGTEKNSFKKETISDVDNWPLEIQKSWPYYIKGSCEMFLIFIEEVKNNNNFQYKREEAEKFYVKIQNAISEKWFKYGSHAFLHHLDAIFGYELIYLQVRYQDEKSRGVIL